MFRHENIVYTRLWDYQIYDLTLFEAYNTLLEFVRDKK